MKNMKQLDCPICGKTLILLAKHNEGLETEFGYWCDDCGTDIRVTTQNTNVEEKENDQQ